MDDPAHEIYKAPRKRHDDRFSEDIPKHIYDAALAANRAKASSAT